MATFYYDFYTFSLMTYILIKINNNFDITFLFKSLQVVFCLLQKASSTTITILELFINIPLQVFLFNA